MMFEARVRTDEAIDATVCVDARALRRDAKSFSTFSCCSISSCSHSISDIGRLFPFKQYFQMTKTRMATTAIPPMTPPAMAPTFGLLGVLLGAVGSIWQLTSAQYSQLAGVKTQIVPAEHGMPSQDRFLPSGHSTQRLNRTCSSSVGMLAIVELVRCGGRTSPGVELHGDGKTGSADWQEYSRKARRQRQIPSDVRRRLAKGCDCRNSRCATVVSGADPRL